MLKQKTRSPVILTVALLALCIGVGAFLLPRLLPVGASDDFALPVPGVGIWVEKGDLFTAEGCTPKELRAETDAFLAFVRENRISEIYWETDLSGDIRNTLMRLSRTAKKAGIAVYAVAPAADSEWLASLEKKTDVTGYVLCCEAEEAESVLAVFSGVTDKPLGLLLQPEGGFTPQQLEQLAASGAIERILPVLSGTLDEPYIEEAARWDSLPVTVRPLVRANADTGEAGLQLFYNTIKTDLDGYTVSYSLLAEDPAVRTQFLSFGGAETADVTKAVDLSVTPALGVGYPADGFSTNTANIYIMGTCDPAQPLTVNGEAVTMVAKKGCFGVEMPLAVGNNTFTLRQGGETVQITVRRIRDTGSGMTTTVSSRFPVSDAPVWAGEEVELRCVAPSGGTVKATVNGITVAMQQTASAAKGIAVTYRGRFTVPMTVPAGELTDLGTVTYALTYGGTVKTFESAGHLYAAGEGVTPMVLATTENVSLLKQYTDDSTILATYHRGARIPATGCLQYGSSIFYEVAGGYISDSRAALDTGVYPVETVVTEITSETVGRDTTITFICGNAPAVRGSVEDGVLHILLENTTLPEDLSGICCDLLTSVAQQAAEGGTELLLTSADPAMLWGYDYQYNEAGDLLLTLKKAPVKSGEAGKPLSGITVMVDPGHGNYDCGALGAAGAAGGPTESEVNLAVGLALQQRLEQLGAAVRMVRTSDDVSQPKIDLDARVRMAVEAKPDFFLSVHHNSTALTKKVTADWMEAYYYEEMSRDFALTLQERITAVTGRPVNEAEWGYYYVTRLCFCPAVLYEVGFLPNPLQYEDCADWLTVYRTAYAMAEAIVASVPEAPPAIAE